MLTSLASLLEFLMERPVLSGAIVFGTLYLRKRLAATRQRQLTAQDTAVAVEPDVLEHPASKFVHEIGDGDLEAISEAKVRPESQRYPEVPAA